MVSIDMPWNGLHSIGFHCFPFRWSGMDTMTLDTNISIAG